MLARQEIVIEKWLNLPAYMVIAWSLGVIWEMVRRLVMSSIDGHSAQGIYQPQGVGIVWR